MPTARTTPTVSACPAGAFEIHVTLQPLSEDANRLQALAACLGCSFLLIELDRGLHPQQPMLTRRMKGTWPEARRDAAALALAVRRAGMAVRRIKIEIGIDHPGAPRDAASIRTGTGYFEHHVRLLLNDTADLTGLQLLVEPLAAHLSRNARRPSYEGRHERFVTQRCQGVGSDEAGQRLDVLLGLLAGAGVAVISCDREYVVHDGRPGLDAGWLDDAVTEGS